MDFGSLIPFLGAGLAAGAMLLFVLGVQGRRRLAGQGELLRGKLARFGGGQPLGPGTSGAPNAPGAPGAAETPARLGALVQGLGRLLGPKDSAGSANDAVRRELIRAGLRRPEAVRNFHGVKAALSLIPPVLFLAVCWLLPKPPAVQILVIAPLFLALLGSYLPNLWLRGKVADRRLQLLCELPDALDLLVVCVEAGMGLDQAIHRVSEELMASAPGICGELRTMTLEMRAGRQRQQSLKDLAERTGLEDVQSLVTLLIQADVFGISVARTLRVYSDTLRTSRFQRAEERATKLPTKLMFPLIMCIFPALLVVIMGPAAIQLMQVFARIGQ